MIVVVNKEVVCLGVCIIECRENSDNPPSRAEIGAKESCFVDL